MNIGIISQCIKLFCGLIDIFLGRTKKRAYLKKDLQYGKELLGNIIIEYQYTKWDTNIRTKKLDVLQKLYESINRYGFRELKKSDTTNKILDAINNIKNIKNVDDIIEIKNKLDYFIEKL